MSVVVLCPSRGRPEKAQELQSTFRHTAKSEKTKLLFLVDSDDPSWMDYPENRLVIDPPPGCMNRALNDGASQVLASDEYRDATVIGFVGDDHRFRTDGWDVTFERFLGEHQGIAYADDLFQRINLPTMWFVSRPIVEVFGMGHPEMRHLWIDDYWKALGEAAGCLYYFQHIVIEHMHPAAGKVEWDENYVRVNSQAMRDHDSGVYERWKANDLATDTDRLKAIING